MNTFFFGFMVGFIFVLIFATWWDNYDE